MSKKSEGFNDQGSTGFGITGASWVSPLRGVGVVIYCRVRVTGMSLAGQGFHEEVFKKLFSLKNTMEHGLFPLLAYLLK